MGALAYVYVFLFLRSELGRRLDEISAQGHVNAIGMQYLVENIKELQSNVESWKHVPGLVESAHNILSRSREAVKSTAQRLILEKLYVGDMTRRFDEIERAHEKTFSWLLGSGTPSTSDFDSIDGSEFSHSDGSAHVPRGDDESLNEGGQNSDQYEASGSGATLDDFSDEEFDYYQQISLERTAKELQAQQGLIDWLAHGGGIFHISGKPGAGESTLMKYLCQITATKSYLKDWAGEKKLILANFFFWKLGSTAQMSLDGLLRALLYSIMEQAPTILETMFPHQWRSATEGGAFTVQTSEIESVFSSLLRQTAFFSSHKVALFIDGLDEFDGDHDKMTKMLRIWSEIAPEDIKLCVSSREWEIFRQRLINCPGIRLQDVTSRDIAAYVNSELSDNEEFRSYSSEDPKLGYLIDQIKDKAEGVFLWVKITLRGLKWGLLSGERLEDIEARLNALPTGLEELFSSILTSIRTGSHTNRLDRTRAMRMLLLAAEPARTGVRTLGLLLTELAFLDDYEKDPNFVSSFPTTIGANRKWVSRQDRARRSVYQRCMGLLEVQSSGLDARPHLMRGGSDFSVERPKRIVSREKNHYEISENPNNEIASSLLNGTARIRREGYLEIIDKGDGIFLHTHAFYVDPYRINHEHPSSERVVCAHRSVVEFLSQPHVKSLIDAEAQSFNLADYRLQTFLASLKLFYPCKGFVKKSLGPIILAYVQRCFQSRELTQDRLLTSCEELIRILEVQTPTPSIGSHTGLVVYFRLNPSELFNATENDGSLGIAVHVDLIADSRPISLDGGFYQLGRRSKRNTYYNVLLDFCLYQICYSWCTEGEMALSYEMRACEYISKCFESGADPNGLSLLKYVSGARFTCWQTWILVIIRIGFSGSFVKLFLRHGADTNMWVHYSDETVSLWWTEAPQWYGVIGDLDNHETGEFRSEISHLKVGSQGEGVYLPLREFLPIWFQDDAELQELCRRYQGSKSIAAPPYFSLHDAVWD